MKGGKTTAFFRAIDQVVMDQHKGMQKLQGKSGRKDRGVIERFQTAETAVGQGKQQGPDSFPLPSDKLTHVEVDRLKHLPVVVPLLLTMEKGLDFPLQKRGKRLNFVP